MVTPLLEQLILRGKAVFNVHTFAYSSFGIIPIPKDKLVIITGIKWNHFFNPSIPDGDNTTLTDCSVYGKEFQLKIESAKSKTYFIFKNGWHINPYVTTTGATTLADLSGLTATPYILHPPEERDTYITCTDFIKLTLTRNVAQPNGGTSNFGLINNGAANEINAPNGMANVPVMLRQNLIFAGVNFFETPAGNSIAGLTATARNYESYAQDISVDASGIVPATEPGLNLFPPSETQPFVEFHFVTVNSNEYNDLINT